MTDSPNTPQPDEHPTRDGLRVPHSPQELKEDVEILLHEAEEHLPPSLRGHSRWWWLAHLALIPTIAFFCLMIWLGTGVRHVAALQPFLIRELDAQLAPMHTEVADVKLYLDTQQWHLTAQADHLKIVDEHGKAAAQFPQIRLKLKWASLLLGHLKIKELGIVSPQLVLSRDASGALRFNVRQDAPSVEQANNAPPLYVEDMMMGLRALGLDKVALYNGSVHIRSGESSLLWHMPLAKFGFKGEDVDALQLYYEVRLSDGIQDATLTGTAHMQEDGNLLDIQAKLERLPLYALAPLHDALKIMAGLKVHLSGTIHAQVEGRGMLRVLDFDLSGQHGLLDDAHFFPEALRIDRLQLQGQLKENATHATLTKLDFKFTDGASLKAVATAKLVHNVTPRNPSAEVDPWEAEVIPEPVSGWDIHAKAQALRVPIDNLKRYWPAFAAPMTREWVVSNITGGLLPRAELEFALRPEDNQSRPLPDDSIKAAVQVETAKVRYLPHMPLIENVSGTVHFTGHAMRADVSTAKTLSASILQQGTVTIPDFFDEMGGIPLQVEAQLTTSAPDVAEILSKERLNLAASLKLDPKKISGTGEGTLKLEVPLDSTYLTPGVMHTHYQIAAKLRDVSQQGVLDKWDIRGLSGTFSAQDSGLNLEGAVNLNGVDGKLTITDVYGEKALSSYRLQATLPTQRLSAFGVKAPPHISGMLGMDATVLEAKDQPLRVKVNADVTDAVMEIPVLNWKKPAGVEASVQFEHVQQDGRDVLRGLQLRSSGLLIDGDVEVAADSGDVVKLDLTQLRYGRSDVRLKYQVDANKMQTLDVRGAVFDATPWVGEDNGEEDSAPKEKTAKDAQEGITKDPITLLSDLQLSAQFGELYMSKKRSFTTFSAELNCVKQCNYVDIHAKTTTGHNVDWQLRTASGGRILRARTDDAGEAFNIVGVTKHVRGGTMTLEGKFEEDTPQHALKAQLNLQDFTIVNGPVLTKLLSLMSLSGLVNTLSGSGIEFKKAEGVLYYSEDLLKVEDLRTHGSALGLTLKGTLSPYSKKMQMDGTLIPAYSANSILGNIPVLGTLLTGGEGGGIIAANFSLKNDPDDPDVMVNPLSLLTPGFLRKVFDIAD